MNHFPKLLLSALLICNMPAHAMQKMYVDVFGGVSQGHATGLSSYEPGILSIINNVDDRDSGDVYGASIGFENLMPELPLSLEFSAMHVNRQTYSFGNFQPDNDDLYSENDRLKVSSNVFLLNGIYKLFSDRALTPFLGLGMGVANNKVAGQFTETTGGGWVGGWRSRTTNNFAYDFKAGLSYSINEHLECGLAYQYISLGKIATNPSSAYSNQATSFNQKLSAKELHLNNILFSIKYKF